MPASDWLTQRTSEAPPALRARVEQALRADASADARADATERLVRVAEQLLAGLAVSRAGDQREAALDLLAADAAVTWAFEKAADDAGTLAARAEDAMRRIAAVVR